MKTAFVGGTWDEYGGKPSSVFNQLAAGYKTTSVHDVVIYNGGFFYSLDALQLGDCQVIVWMPNVPNELQKIVNIKAKYPKAIVVTSKRNTENDSYTFQDIIAHGLKLKSNLILEIGREPNGKRFSGRLFDPLGNVWCTETTDFYKLGIYMENRCLALVYVQRQGTIPSPEKTRLSYDINEIDDFCEILRNFAEVFHKLINPSEGVTRFLGNASFRCMRGFPSFKTDTGDIFVSKRNVDKRSITPDAFVQVGLNDETDVVWYRGPNKPSVDTVIQVRLYNLPLFCNIKYMVHSHVYIEDAPFTTKMIPCGGLQEISEIVNAVEKISHPNMALGRFAINLLGHGSIIFASQLNLVNKFKFVSRPSPEIMARI